MFNNLKNKFFVLLFLSFPLYGFQNIETNNTAVIPITKSTNEIIDDYLKWHKQFVKEQCPRGSEQFFLKTYQQYKGEGIYIPLLENDEIDLHTMATYLPLVEQKSHWIEKIIEAYVNNYSVKNVEEKLRFLKTDLIGLVQLKHQFDEAEDQKVKEILSFKSTSMMGTLKQHFYDLVKEVPFLLGFQFPVDHLYWRKIYDVEKSKKENRDQQKINQIYFQRRILEDGALASNNVQTDSYLRANMSSIAKQFDRAHQIIPEDLRFDLVDMIKGVENWCSQDRQFSIKRLKNWAEKTRRTVQFYNDLVGAKKNNESDLKYHSLSQARHQLKSWVQEKEIETYRFWRQREEIHQALFVMETILLNEVGDLDGREALERKDVAQIILNRYRLSEYTTFENRDTFWQAFLSKYPDKNEQQQYLWGNLLFKEGEFSFTYYFIPSVQRIFCPDLSPRARFLRKENLKIAIDKLRQPNWSFKAERYYSRASMLGRIDMGEIWSGYRVLNEMPGSLLLNRLQKMKRLYRDGDYLYRYSFTDEFGERYKVFEVSEVPYVVSTKSNMFYEYRGPHHFQYFVKQK